MVKEIIAIFGFTLIFLAAWAKPAHAYLDPGSGSYLFQIIIGAVLGGAFAVKSFWSKIISFLKKKKNK